MKRHVVIAVCALIVILFGCPGPAGPSDGEQVRRVVNDLREQEADRVRREQTDWNLGEHMSTLAGDYRTWVRAGVIGLCLFAGLALLFLLLRFALSRRNRSLVGQVIRDQKDERVSLDADTLAAQGDYGQAVLALHRFSILMLIAAKTILSKNLTNTGIAARIADPVRRQAFQLIAAEGENILFDRKESTAADWKRCRAAFADRFMLRGGGAT